MSLSGLGIAGLAIFLVVQKTRKGRASLPDAELVPVDGATFLPGAAITEDDESEIMAVITAAIAEFEGDNDFQVASIKRRANNWKLTGCQELVSGRLN